jgi:hypothetical protein
MSMRTDRSFISSIRLTNSPLGRVPQIYISDLTSTMGPLHDVGLV